MHRTIYLFFVKLIHTGPTLCSRSGTTTHPRKGENNRLKKRLKPQTLVLSVHKPTARPLRGRAGCRWCTEGASFLSFFFSFPSFFFSKDSTPSLSPPLPLSQTSSETPFLSLPRPLHPSTKT